MNAIKTNLAPEAIGPYSQAVDTGDFLFLSGQLPIDPNTGQLTIGIADQTHQVLKNIQRILEVSGLTFKNVVKFSIYIASMEDFATLNSIYADYLSEPYPARSTVEVSRLPKDALVEMDVIAKKEK